MIRFLLICCGGAVGTGARYLLGTWIGRGGPGSFPWSTLIVNLIGSFTIGVATAAMLRSGGMSETARLVLTTGVLGGFTTYSAFNQETLGLFGQGEWTTAFVYAIATFAGCLAAGAFGAWLGVAAGRGAS